MKFGSCLAILSESTINSGRVLVKLVAQSVWSIFVCRWFTRWQKFWRKLSQRSHIYMAILVNWSSLIEVSTFIRSYCKDVVLLLTQVHLEKMIIKWKWQYPSRLLFDYWHYVTLVVVLWCPALSSSASVTTLRWDPVMYMFNFWCEYRSWPWLEMHKRNFWYVQVQGHMWYRRPSLDGF